MIEKDELRYYPSPLELQLLKEALEKYLQFPDRSIQRSRIIKTYQKKLFLVSDHWNVRAVRLWINNHKHSGLRVANDIRNPSSMTAQVQIGLPIPKIKSLLGNEKVKKKNELFLSMALSNECFVDKPSLQIGNMIYIENMSIRYPFQMTNQIDFEIINTKIHYQITSTTIFNKKCCSKIPRVFCNDTVCHFDKASDEKKIQSPIGKIQDILISENSNNRIMDKISKSFSQSDIILAILILSLKNNILCLKLVNLFKFLIERLPSSFIDDFYRIANSIESSLFLQLCCFFKIFSIDELKQKISFKINDFFCSFPKIDFKTNNDILEKARDKKSLANKDEKIKSLHEDNEKFQLKICELQSKLKFPYEENNNLIKQINEIKKDFLSKLGDMKKKISNERDHFYTSIAEENLLISKKKLSQFPIFECLIKRYFFNEFNENFYKFCTVLKLLNKRSYNYIHSLIPLYCSSSCKSYMSPYKANLEKIIQDENLIYQLLEIFYNGLIEFQDHHTKSQIIITLCGDAASLKPAFTSTKNAIYTFHALPLNCFLPNAVVNCMPANNGPSSIDVVNKFEKIISILNNLGFYVKYTATDRDKSFDTIHDVFFNKYILPIIDEDFITIIKYLKDVAPIRLSDLLHLLKSARTRLLNYLVMVDPVELKCVNTSLFAEAVNLGPVFTDKNSSAAMKDDYALLLFSWFSFVQTMKNGRFDASYYILPFVLMNEAQRSPLLSINTRMNFLKTAFSIFRLHYKQLKECTKGDLFQQRFTKSCIGVLFGEEIFLKRIINTCVGIGVSLLLEIENLALQRESSHNAELFYGHMRFFSFYDNTYSNALKVITNAILIRKYSNEIGHAIQIDKRDNKGGIVLTHEINNLPDIEFDSDVLINTVRNLMLEKDVEQDKINDVVEFMNEYTSLIIKSDNYKQLKIPNLVSGRLPFGRYVNLNYAIGLLPIPKNKSVFDFYCAKKESKRRFEKLTTLRWCLQTLEKIYASNSNFNVEIDFEIPFQYDIKNPKSRKEISVYVDSKCKKKSENKESPKLLSKEKTEKHVSDSLQEKPNIENQIESVKMIKAKKRS